MGGVVGSIGKAVGSTAKMGGLTPSPQLGAAMGDVIGKSGGRGLFCALLLATVEHVHKKPHFNLELEINDLMIRLGGLRQMSEGAASSGVGAQAQLNQISATLAATMRAMGK